MLLECDGSPVQHGVAQPSLSFFRNGAPLGVAYTGGAIGAERLHVCVDLYNQSDTVSFRLGER